MKFAQVSPFANQVFAVQPTKFRSNAEALEDNRFMDTELDTESSAFDEAIQAQHSAFISNIRSAGVEVDLLVQPSDDAPDAVFPDWFTSYRGENIPGGVLILHPMIYQSRRNERTPETVAHLRSKFEHIIDLTHFEKSGLALEGKGSIVFHHRAHCFLVARSNRASVQVIDELVQQWNKLSKVPYRAITFEARDANDDIIYHTDCMMSLLGRHAFCCTQAIKDPAERKAIEQVLYPLEIIDLTYEQIGHMAANSQCVSNSKGEFCVI